MEVRARYILVGLFAFAAIAAGFGFVIVFICFHLGDAEMTKTTSRNESL